MAEKKLEYYLNLPYKIEILPEPDEGGYTAVVPDLPGCMTSAQSLEQLSHRIQEAKQLWLETALSEKDYIPEPLPTEIDEPSGKFMVRMPRSLHGQLSARAEIEGVSLNQLVVSILSSGMGQWLSQVVSTQVRFRKSV
jgi:predicted RNase H-like HicB family nuclease